MIACIEGRVLETAEHSCVIQTSGGVGYEVFAPGYTLSRLSGAEEVTRLFTATIVREDAIVLYGFETWDERETFLTLISISKVGPRTAIAVLSRYRPGELRTIVASEDIMALTLVPGIGKKTAQHVFLELKYKLKMGDLSKPTAVFAAPGSVFADTLQGLSNLGYSEEETRPVLVRVLQEEPDLDVAGALRMCLKALARGL